MNKDLVIFLSSTTVGVIGLTLSEMLQILFLSLSSLSLLINIIKQIKNGNKR